MASVALARGSSPHTRGARPAPRHRRRPAGIIPAYAGSTGRRRSCESRRRDHPRIRGEHDGDLSRISHVAGSSPHTRGAHLRQHGARVDFGIIPAYAGSTMRASITRAPSSDHPRIRGEHCEDVGVVVEVVGIIPAYAGSTKAVWGGVCRVSDHPRIRGEHSWRRLVAERCVGSSPHTRGALSAEGSRHLRGRIIPAYAGSTGGNNMPVENVPGSSPHTRGAPQPHQKRASGRRIIPAYAGSTAASSSTRRRRPDHPRIRGEHVSDIHGRHRRTGSSPHTRGAQRPRRELAVHRGIIPAYAGSTPRCSRGT